jgi:hypothetical protein
MQKVGKSVSHWKSNYIANKLYVWNSLYSQSFSHHKRGKTGLRDEHDKKMAEVERIQSNPVSASVLHGNE